MIDLKTLTNTPAWLTPQLKDGETISPLALYLPPGTFAEGAKGEVFNQKSVYVPMFDPCGDLLVHSLLLDFQGDSNEVVLHCQEGGVRPLIVEHESHKSWRMPVGSIFIRERLQGIFFAEPTFHRPPRGWKRRSFIYCNPETPFLPSAILYMDDCDLPCFVEEFDPVGEAIAVVRFRLQM